MSRTPSPLHPQRIRRWIFWLWPLAVLAAAWLVAPFRASGDFPGMPCTAGVATVIERFSYLIFFVPAAVILLLLTALARRAWRRRVPLLGLALGTAALVGAGLYLAFGALAVQPSGEQATACPPATAQFTPLHCWKQTTPVGIMEMNAYGQRPLDLVAAESLGRALAANKRDVFLDEAFILDTREPAIADYSNGRLFVLQRPDLSVFGSQCLNERRAQAQLIGSHRVAFYRYSNQRTPPVDALFLPHAAQSGERQYEVFDFRNGLLLPYVAPTDLRQEEAAYLDHVVASLQVLNDDLDREQVRGAPASTLQAMRTDFERITQDLAQAPARLVTYRDSRLRRFLENYQLILVAEENAGNPSAGQIHSAAYEQHRQFYYQEPRVTRLIGYLYLQEPAKSFTDDQLSTVNWAVF